MGESRRRVTGGILAALCVTVLASGCAATAEEPPAPTTSVTPTEPAPSETPDAEEPVADDDILFVINAKVRATDGRTVGISMAAHQPIASDRPQAEDLRSEFLELCGEGVGGQPITEEYLAEQGSTLLPITLATDTPGEEFVEPLELFFGSPYFAQAAVGDGIEPVPGGEGCFYGYLWTTSGDARGISDFENPGGIPDPGQWRYGHYGFMVSPESGATIEACRVTITEQGQKAQLDGIEGWDPSTAGTGTACGIGYAGE